MSELDQPLLAFPDRQPHAMDAVQQQLQVLGDRNHQLVNLSCMSTTLLYWSKGPPFRIVVGLVCCLSIVGALLIIFSYACFKSLRSRARLVLVHLSLTDLGVALMNLLGNIIHFDSYYVHNAAHSEHTNQSSKNTDNTNNNSLYSLRDSDLVCEVYSPPDSAAVRHTCSAQAFLAQYFTYASVLWTVALAVCIYFIIVHYRKVYVRYVLRSSYFLCYGLPLIVSLWLLCTERLGYSPQNGAWCSIVLQPPGVNTREAFAAFFGYDLWIYLAFVVVPIFFISVKLFIREKVYYYI